MTTKAAFIYGARSRTFLSGTPYYFARALEVFGKERKAFDVVDMAPRRTREVPLTYARWCLASRTTRNSLFLLSKSYHDASGRDFAASTSVQPYFIAFTQCTPASVLACRRSRPEVRLIRYIDATFLDLFETFDYASNPPANLRRKMLRAERDGYNETDLFAVFHAGVRDRLVNEYGVAHERVWVLGRGVNLDLDTVDHARVRPRSSRDEKFHMMVVGRGPKRKGVYKLIEAIETLSANEQNRLMLTVAGPNPRELPNKSYLRRLGFLSADQREYLAQEMVASDLGVLLSEADSHPGSIWEFLSLGMPVWVSRLPYITDALEGYPAIIEDPPLDIASMAARLRSFIYEPQELAALRNSKTRSTKDLTWAVPAARLGEYIITN
jgi:glycosyltransferase involved in cell wall biosynthesis